jgi:hypothetical protein
MHVLATFALLTTAPTADGGAADQCDQGLVLACGELEKGALGGVLGRALANVAWPNVDPAMGDLAIHVKADRTELLPERPLTDLRAALERIHIFPVRVDLLIDANASYGRVAAALKQVLDAGGKPRLVVLDRTGAPRFFTPSTVGLGAQALWTVAISDKALMVSAPGSNAKTSSDAPAPS